MSSRLRFPVVALLSLGLLVVGCGDNDGDRDDDTTTGPYDAKVEVEVNQNVDLADYTTYDIVSPIPSATGHPPRELLDTQAVLEDAIVAELGSKGLIRDRSSPQLLVNPLVNREQAPGVAQFYDAVYGWYWGYGHVWTTSYAYAAGSLVIDVVDRRDVDEIGDDLLVYRGAVDGLMAQDAEVIRMQLRDSIQAIFAPWPSSRPAT